MNSQPTVEFAVRIFFVKSNWPKQGQTTEVELVQIVGRVEQGGGRVGHCGEGWGIVEQGEAEWGRMGQGGV